MPRSISLQKAALRGLVIIIDFISVIASLLIMVAGTDTLREEIIEALRTGLEEAGKMLLRVSL